MSKVITLLTDFGTRDTYVAQMKAVLLTRVESPVQIIDISHEVPPQDIRQASRMLGEVAMQFPPGTVHLVVVDPGVGSNRRILAVAIEGRRFVLPDNGLLSDVVAAYPDAVIRAHAVDNSRIQIAETSRTFHGRDIMAPVAAFLSQGGELSEVGPEVDGIELLTSPQYLAPIGGWVAVRVVSVDHFGNILTDFHERQLQSSLPELQQSGLPGQPVIEVETAAEDTRLKAHWVGCYADAQPGDVVALFSSQQRLELAVVNGSAARELGLRVGDILRLRVQKP